MYGLIIKPIIVTIVVASMLFLFHVFGPEVAQAYCPYLNEVDPALTGRCNGFFSLLG